jgi:signal transduction histidine kinase
MVNFNAAHINMKNWLSNLKNLKKHLGLIGSAIALTYVLIQLPFSTLEANLYDFRMTQGVQPAVNRDIVLITLDDATTRGLSDFAPLPLDVHARLLENLELLNPRAVGYLVNMNDVSQVNPELFEKEWGLRFVDAANRMSARGIPFLMGTPFDVNGEILPPYPLSSLPHAIAVIHKDGNFFAEDRVTRRALLYLYDKPTFHVQMAQASGLIPEGFRPKGTYGFEDVEMEYFFFRYAGSPGSKNTYTQLSFLDILEGKVAPGALAGKVVLIGSMIRQNAADFTKTPFEKSSLGSPKIYLHANIIDSIAKDNGISLAPTWLNAMITFVLILLVLVWVLESSPMRALIATIAMTVGFLAGALLLFHGAWGLPGLWIYESQPLVGVFLAFYLAVPYRLFREYSKRWDFQRKTEILTRVEELKTNFLSLVTHDLKTPVARIQGLAEVLSKKASERLLPRDQKTLGQIVDSTDELNRFISSILELAKLESNRLQLNIESKDVNQIIERALEVFKAPAKSKGIQLSADLEPQFPIKLDPLLISKVINNLIDNALKYSPENSEVRVQTREKDGWIEISVCDQGIGLSAEERENLFTKFYRAKNDTTTRVTGTGLGLYLTKFFVHAHGGRVEVESEKGVGSYFRIYLPVQADPKTLGFQQAEGKRPGLRVVSFLSRKHRKQKV